MLQTIKNTLQQLIQEIEPFEDDLYSSPCMQLREATVGKHTRHIIEMFGCLLNGYDTGTFSYDHRQRNKDIEVSFKVAKVAINRLILQLDKPDKLLTTSYEMSGEIIVLQSNYYRELMYNLEHCVHHQALIKVAIESMSGQKLSDNFGVAPSTISYRETCVQ